MSDPHVETRQVQSCITTVSFPEFMDEFLLMVEKNGDGTDLHTLMTLEADDEIGWSAARWMLEGDILFFYHAKKAKGRINRLIREAEELKLEGMKRTRLKMLKQEAEYARGINGTIFACAYVVGPSEHYRSEEFHFKSNVFAPLGTVHIFEHPLTTAEFSSVVKIGQATVTPLYGDQFAGIKTLLARTNRLPDFLANARHRDRHFRDVDKSNWLSISCQPDVRFIDEAQVRAYFIDYLLEAIKDPRTALYRECRCFRNGVSEHTGYADYFVTINQKWIPVEAKLSVLSEKDISGQIRKYINISHFIPTQTDRLGNEKSLTNIRAEHSDACVVIDQLGVYFTRGGEFIDCVPGYPLVSRTDLSQDALLKLRSTIIKLL